MKKNLKNKKGGFLQLIIIIIVVLLLIKYFNITLSGIIDWIKNLI